MGIFQRGMNPGAYSGKLTCPACSSQAIRYVENVGPYRLRFRCRKCGQYFQYETGRDLGIHPYAPFKKHWRSIVEGKINAEQLLRGRKIK